MKHLLQDLAALWRRQLVFRVAAAYLFLFLLLAVLLPWLPLPYQATDLHLDRVYQPPFAAPQTAANQAMHIFGTDALGRDVLTYTLQGARTALFLSLPVMLLASLLGLALGAAAGYFENTGLKISWARLIVLLPGCGLVAYLGLYVPVQVLLLGTNVTIIIDCLGLLLLLLVLLQIASKGLHQLFPGLRAKTALPLDRLVLWLIELFTSVPKLVFILVLAAFLPPSVMLLCAVLVATYWTGTARLARAEMLKIKNLPFFEAATSIGASRSQLLLYHAFPNLLGPVLIAFSFGLSGLLAFESTLSFLGIGLPADFVSWGKMIAAIRGNTSAWWLAFFPGIFLVLTVLALQLCSYYYLELLRSRKS